MLKNILQISHNSQDIFIKNWLSPWFLAYTIQSAQIVSLIPSLSIVLMNNNPNWKNAMLLLLILLLIDLIFLILLAYNQKSNITIILSMNNWLTYLVILQTHLILIKIPVPTLTQEKLKHVSLILLVVLSLTSSIISFSNVD